jgi:hypothetical protein
MQAFEGGKLREFAHQYRRCRSCGNLFKTRQYK